MIDDQDRVRVMDFGLARVVDDAEEGAGVSVAISSGSESISLTEVGVRLGTPAYMAPEQHLGCLTDARTDQFALCVALYEALYGARPFVGDDRQSLAEQVVAGRLPDPPRGRVPAWLRRAVLRGLANDMDRRWPSMQALVTELERGQVRARFVIVAVVVVVVATLAIGAWTVRRREDTRRLDACVAAGASIAEVWNDSVRRRVHASLAATGLRYSASVADKALPWLDRYASAWSEARGAACLRAGVDASWDLETQARSLGCLDERRLALESLVDELAEADAGVAARAIQLAAGLDDVRPCLDAAQLAQQPRPPAELRGPLRAVQTQLARAYSLQGAGKGEAGLTAARKAQAGAEALAWPSLVAASRYRVGALLAVQGDYAGAEAQLEDAYFTALAAAAPPVLADAAIELMDVVGMRRERQVDAERWARFAAVTLRSLEPSEGLRTANYLDARAALRARADAHDEARALYARVLAIRERLLDPDHPDVAAAYHELANIDGIQGGSEAALTSYARALAIRERTLGPDSVEVAGTCHNMAILHLELGRHAEALAAEERALALLERARGSDHPSVGTCLNTLGNIRRGMGAPAEARALYTRAMDILTRKLGPDHSFVATSLYNLALLDLREGRLAAAHAGMRRAVEIRERALGPGNLMVASTLVGLGRIELALGELAAARTTPRARARHHRADPRARPRRHRRRPARPRRARARRTPPRRGDAAGYPGRRRPRARGLAGDPRRRTRRAGRRAVGRPPGRGPGPGPRPGRRRPGPRCLPRSRPRGAPADGAVARRPPGARRPVHRPVKRRVS